MDRLGIQAFARGLALDNCGCFGVYAAQPLRWWVLVEDVEVVALAVWVVRRPAPGRPSSPRPYSPGGSHERSGHADLAG